VSDPFGYEAQGGYYTDQSTGLILTSFRYYDPANGRFLNRDPIGFEGGMNLYGYCGNGATGESDPLGLNPLGFWPSFGKGLVNGLIGGAIIVGGAALVVGFAPEFIAVGGVTIVTATAVTGVLYTAGVIGGALSVSSMIMDHSPGNLGSNLGGIAGGALIGGLAGRGLAGMLGKVSGAPESSLLWRDLDAPGNKLMGLIKMHLQWNTSMSTGPTPKAAGGAITFGGAGVNVFGSTCSGEGPYAN
jgi:RHS repeat-associated protein